MALSVDIEKRMGRFHLKSLFEAGSETLAILGASGCGKSVTLKCVAGIMTPDRGRIVLNGRVLFDSEKKINVPARSRGTGYLFQNYALFPNMTVEQNIACGIPKGRDKVKTVKEKIASFYLEGLERYHPGQLSGGQQQRVALARMLASEPELLMLDEPLSALDSFLRWQLEQEILKVEDSFEGTILYVSHSRDEVYRLCDRVAVMEDGSTIEVLEKKELFQNPQTLSTALMSGCKNFSAAEKTGPYTLFAKDWNATLVSSKSVPDGIKYAGIRAHFLEVAQSPGRNVLECGVTRVIEDMFSTIIIARVKGGEGDWANLRCELDKEEWNKTGSPETLYLRVPEDQLILMR